MNLLMPPAEGTAVIGLNEWIYTTIEPWVEGRVLEVDSTVDGVSGIFLRNGRTIHLSSANKSVRDKLRASYEGVEEIRSVLAIDFRRPDFESCYPLNERLFNTIVALKPMTHGLFDPVIIRNACLMLPVGGRLIVLAPTPTTLYDTHYQAIEEIKPYNRKFTLEIFANGMRAELARYVPHTAASIYGQSGVSVLAVGTKL